MCIRDRSTREQITRAFELETSTPSVGGGMSASAPAVSLSGGGSAPVHIRHLLEMLPIALATLVPWSDTHALTGERWKPLLLGALTFCCQQERTATAHRHTWAKWIWREQLARRLLAALLPRLVECCYLFLLSHSECEEWMAVGLRGYVPFVQLMHQRRAHK